MYKLITTKKFDKSLQKMDSSTRDRIIEWMENAHALRHHNEREPPSMV